MIQQDFTSLNFGHKVYFGVGGDLEWENPFPNTLEDVRYMCSSLPARGDAENKFVRYDS